MNAQGNHGGSSDHERDAVAVFFPGLLRNRDDDKDTARSGAQSARASAAVDKQEKARAYGVPFQIVWQLDMAPTLALLMGLDIPHQSIGKLLPRTLDHFFAGDFLRALDKNAVQLSRLLSEGDAEAAKLNEMLAKARDAKNKCLRNVDGVRVTVLQLRNKVGF